MATAAPKTIQSSNLTVKGTQNQDLGFGMANNTKTYENFSYFLGGIDVTHQNLDQFTPYIPGVSRIFLHKPPLFLFTNFEDKTKQFKTYLETAYKGVSGIADVDVEFTQFQGGFNAQEFESIQSARDATNSVTIQLYELTGSPVREYLDLWVTGVRDIRSGIAHYHGGVEGINGLKKVAYGEINHTAEMIYVTYDPTGLRPEYACMFAHCFPRRVPKDHLNYASGTRDGVQLDLEFSTTKYESPAINDIGIWYTNNSRIKWNYLDFDPNLGEGYMKQNGNVYTYNYGEGENPTMNSYGGGNLTGGNRG